jgi:hypothetical protein
MTKKYALQFTPSGWQFIHETALENFVWDHLETLFGYQPLRRQHHVDGNYCDILAIAPSCQLVIIELKNAEDRYVVQQLTRYYHKLQQAKPFSDRVGYSQPILLIVLSPQLHEDNAIDVLYHKLDFQLLKFDLQGEQFEEPIFSLIDFTTDQLIGTVTVKAISDSNVEKDAVEVPPPPRTFLTRLAKSTQINPQHCLDVREKILQLDSKIKEIKYDNSSYLYGLGKSNFLGGILFHKSSYKSSDILWPRLMLRLPVKTRRGHPVLSRCLIPGIFLTESEAAKPHHFLEGTLHTGASTPGKHTSEVIWMHIFLGRFLQRELQQRVSSESLVSHLQTYCQLKNLPDPTMDRDAALEFFLLIALNAWQSRL